MTTRLVIDTDTAGDDVFSLLLGLLHPEATLEAITICCGNVAFDQEVENALYTIEIAGRGGDVPVFAGCRRPLIAEWVGAEYVHGDDGMGEAHFPRARQRPEREHAVDALVRLIDDNPGELTLIAQAPLTNIATAVVRDPTIAGKVKHLYVMGGGSGNVTPAAEYNFYVDPEAAKIVFRAGFSLTLVTWTLTLSHGIFTTEQLAAIDELGTPLAAFFAQVNRKALEFCLARGLAGSSHPDALTCALALDPALVTQSTRCFVDVETAGDLTRGYSSIDRLGFFRSEPNADVVEAVDSDAFYRMLVGVLGREPRRPLPVGSSR